MMITGNDDEIVTSRSNENTDLERNKGNEKFPPLTEEEDDDRTYRLILSKLRNYDFRHLGPHPPSLTSEESAATRRRLGWDDVTLASGAKAMLIKNGTRKNTNNSSEDDDDRPFVLAVMAADERLDWKKMKKMLGPKSRSKGARMATVEEMWDVTGCKPGAVPPFGSVFVPPSKVRDDSSDGGGGSDISSMMVHTFVDRSLQRQGGVINFNCGLRTRSIQMAFGDYLDVEKPELCDFIVEDS